jgi:diguanylate cyclase (GGDEF)-like protein/PAS domain S-box-containing protein
LAAVTFLDKQALRAPGLPEKISDCLEVAHASRNGQVDALLVPGVEATLPLLAAGADSIYRFLVETLQEGILTVDLEGTILFTNWRTAEILGCEPDSLLGLNALELVEAVERPWIKVKIDEALRGTTWRCELGLAYPGQARVNVLVSLGLIDDIGDGTSGVCLALTDLSEEKRLRDELQMLATTDPLTELYNRRYLAESLEKECRRVTRYGRPLSCLMIDIDGLKLCNDRYGHLTGDDVLRQVAALIKGSVRDTDVVARYGGEEFCVLLPETPYEAAMQMAERIRAGVAAQPLSVGEQPVSITVSIGVWGSSDSEELEPDTVLGYADAGLMEAKAAGKNRVCAHPSRLRTVA